MHGSGQLLGLHRAQGRTPERAAGPSRGGFLGKGWGKEAVSLLRRKHELIAWLMTEVCLGRAAWHREDDLGFRGVDTGVRSDTVPEKAFPGVSSKS